MKHLYAFALLITTITLHTADNAKEIKRAIERDDRERVRQLVNVDNVNAELHGFECTFLLYATLCNNDIALDLIKLGANVQCKNHCNSTPLHFAAFYNRPIVAQKLLEAGALTTEKDADGKTPLDIAKYHKHSEVREILESYEHIEDIKEPENK